MAIAVSVEYDLDEANEAAFLEAMQDMRRSRLRSGSIQWTLYRVGEAPHRFVELFVVSSWDEHLRQHQGRLTADDQAIEDRAASLVIGAPRARHLLPPETPRLPTADEAWEHDPR